MQKEANMHAGEQALELVIQLIKRLGLNYCREYLIVFDGNETCPKCKARYEQKKAFIEALEALKEK
jgi:uncharacterized protein (UPF0212 family)